MSGKGAVDRQTDDIASTTVLGVPRDPRAPRDKHPAWQGPRESRGA